MRIENETHENYFQIPLDFILLFADLQKPDGWYHTRRLVSYPLACNF